MLPPKDPENPKVKYSAQELKDLKGPNAGLIGYVASVSDLEIGSTVVVYVDKKWKAPMPPAKKKKKGEEAAEEEEKPIPIFMIVIPKPPPEATGNPLLGGGN